MEIFVHNICPSASPPGLKRSIAKVLHGPEFEDYSTLPLNFDFFLLPPTIPGAQSGKLTLPSLEVGEHFMREYGGYRPRMDIAVGKFGQRLVFKESRNDPRP